MKLKLVLFLLVLSSYNFFGQNISGIINSYAAVTSINTNTVCVNTTAGFAVGDKVMLIQMQGANIINTNNASFGNLAGVGAAGQYEFNFVGAINGLCVTLTCPVINTYSVPASVQLIKVPVYPNATITSTLTCQAWNGTTGGVLAFEATNLTCNSDINVAGLGFRGGAFASGGFCCSSPNFVTNSVAGGQKGEAIARYLVNMDGSKGKNANGGGGANCGNSGGGGGGNGGAGGMGGNQYNGCGAGDNGQGAVGLAPPTNLLYMGGGGGGGFRDNGMTCTAGGNGGAIVFIISSQITGNGRVFCAKGNDVTINAVDEGSGGGGAGGSVYILCPTYVGPLTIDCRGGKGGSNFNSVFPSNCHGPGGGGGGGVYAFSPAAMPGTVTYSNGPGTNGLVLNPSSTCFNTGWGALPGIVGTSVPNLSLAVTVPTITIAGTPTVCTGSSVTLTASGSTTYTWSTAALTSTISVAPTALTIYTVIGGAATCTNTATYTVSPIPQPTLSIAGTFSVCANQGAPITASGATTYTWNTGATTAAITPSPAVTTVYTVSGTSASTCSGSATATITVSPSPTAILNSNSPVCVGQPINFSGGGGGTYLWNGPSFNSSVQNPTILVSTLANSGTYTLTVTDVNNCTGTTTKNVIVNPLPNVAAIGSTVCINQTINLGANGGTTYAWTGPAGFFSASQNPNINNAALINAGQYNVLVTDANTCTNTAMAMVGVNPIPTPTAQSSGPICVNQIMALSASGGLNYSWSGPQGFFSSAQSPTLLTTSAATSGNYSVTVSDAIGCSAIAVVNVTVNALPSPNISSSLNKGCMPLCMTFTVQNPTAISNCNWNFGDGSTTNGTTGNNCYRIPGTFTITADVTDMNGCMNTALYTANSYPLPVADFNYAPLQPIVGEGTVNFSDASYGAPISSWNWYFTNTAANTSNLQNPTFVYPEVGNYDIVLVVKSDKGCKDTIIRSIVVYEDFGLFIPNSFTPNDDGNNDTFYAKGFGVTKYEMEIYDRWGEKLFHTNNFGGAWDGTNQIKGSKTINDGVYVWRIKVTNVYGKSKELTGHVTLIK